MIPVKAHYIPEGQTRRFLIERDDITLQDFLEILSEKVSRLFNRRVLVEDIFFQYADDDRDWIDISTQDEWDEALRICPETLRVRVSWVKSNPMPKNEDEDSEDFLRQRLENLHVISCNTSQEVSEPEEEEENEEKENEEEQENKEKENEENEEEEKEEKEKEAYNSEATTGQESVYSDQAVVGEQQVYNDDFELQEGSEQNEDLSSEYESWENITHADAEYDENKTEEEERNNKEEIIETYNENETESNQNLQDEGEQTSFEFRNEEQTQTESQNETENTKSTEPLEENRKEDERKNNAYEDQQRKLSVLTDLVNGAVDMPQGHQLHRHCRIALANARNYMADSFIPELDALAAKLETGISNQQQSAAPYQYQDKLNHLKEMGFTDEDKLKQLLDQFGGDLKEVCTYLVK